MKRRDQLVTVVSWVLALLVPLLAGAASWLWVDVTTTVRECVTGSGGGYGDLVAFLLLVLAGPTAVAWQVRRAGRSIGDALVPVFASTARGFALVYLGGQLWWTGHDCMT